MIRAFFLACAFFAASSAFSAAPSVVCTPNRTSGAAPLGITLDCSGTTGGTKPFHNLQYTHTFGDSAAGSWSTGARSGQSKNFATGPIAGYVYETAGSYTITSTVCNSSGECGRATNAITVTAANTTFNQAATKCFYQTAPSGDCPNGGTETQVTGVGADDFDGALSGCIGATKRCLFQRGSTFTASAPTSITTATGLIGAYGSGALPIINSSSVSGVISFGASSSDVRVMDLDIRGAGAGDTGAAITSADTTPFDITILRVTIYNIGKGITVTGTNYLIDSVIQDCTITQITAASGGVGIFGRFLRSAILGNTVGPFATTAEHLVRIQPATKTVISNNTLTTPGDSGKAVLTIRALDHVTEQPDADSQYTYISDNYMNAGPTSVQMFDAAPASTTQNHWISDVIIERNWLVFGAVTQSGFNSEASTVTVRNNVCDSSAGASGGTGRTCFSNGSYTNTAGAPTPDDNFFHNNTCYDSATGTNQYCFNIGAARTTTNSVVKNNLSYYTQATQPKAYAVSNGTATDGNNTCNWDGGGTSCVGQTDTSPLFTNVASPPQGFAISTSSYADNGGTATGTFPGIRSDFNNCWDKNGANRIGALVPRADAICVGAP